MEKKTSFLTYSGPKSWLWKEFLEDFPFKVISWNTETLTTVRLIRFVLAVRVAVTFPRQPHTFAVGTAKLPSGAVGPSVEQVRRPVAAAALRPLVGAVRAVGVSVAAPHERHTLWGVAAEVVRPAGQRGAALELVAAVPTVVIAVAHVGGGQALPVGTHELPSGTGFGIWRSRIKKKTLIVSCKDCS